MTVSGAGFTLSARHRAEVDRIDPRLSSFLPKIEWAIAGHLDPAARRFDPVAAGLSEWRGLPIETLDTLDQFSAVAEAAAGFVAALAGLSAFRQGELAEHLSPFPDHGALVALVDHAAPPGARDKLHPDLLPFAALAERVSRVAVGLVPGRAKGRPQRFTWLVETIVMVAHVAGVISFDEPAGMAAPSGPVCRLVGLCLDAAGEPVPSNIAQIVRRALDYVENAEAAAQADYPLWLAHIEQKCTPESCHFCSP